ncbi:MAG: S53 family peptidase [Terracidiphilus sp.]
MNKRVSLLVLSIAAILTAGTMDGRAQSLMTRHVRDAVLNGQAHLIGPLPASQQMQLDIVLPLSDPAGLTAFLKDLRDPSSPSYRQYLTPQEFTARFGPTQANYDAVVAFVKANGLAVVGGSRDGMDVQVKGPVSAINAALHITLQNYQHPTENRVFYAPDREPTVSLPFALWHISGLDNYSIPHPMFEKKSDYAAAHGISPDAVVPYATTGSGPSASFLGSDMRAAYYGGTALTGAGQNLGLFEYLGTDLTDLTTYFANAKETNNVPITLLSTDGTSTSCLDTRAGGDCDDTEQTLDMTQAIGMAPGLASLVMYIGSTDTAIISAMTTHSPLPTTIGCSWGWTPADPTTLDPYFEKMAAQGQNFFAASGDSSTWSSSNEAWPADDANVVSVGGTDLETASAAGPWASETAWTDSGGGISPDKIAIPSWQQLSGVINSSNKGSTTLRNGPDVSANANFTFYVCADQTTCTANEYGGTSFATPMWAGYIALVNQQLVANGEATIGFLDPIIYPIGVSSSYDTDFHDITSGTSGSYSAVTGYDLVTGWGSPNGQALINALAGTSATAGFSLSATAASVTAGSTGNSTVTETVTGGFDSAVTLSASGLPTGVTAAFSPTSITGAGTSTLTFTAASTAAAGSYTITVTGTPASGSTETTTLTLTVSAASTPSFSLSATAASVKDGSTGTSTVTETVTNGFDSAVTLSASGLPTGVTAAFSPTSITGAGTSTLTFTAASTATAGSYTITVTGTPASGTAKTTTLTLTVTAVVTGSFTISVSPTSGYLDQGQSGYGVVTTKASGGFDSVITFSATGIPSGVTGSFSPTSVTGSGTTDFTLTVSRTAPTGTYPITITGTGGGLAESTVLTFSVRR